MQNIILVQCKLLSCNSLSAHSIESLGWTPGTRRMYAWKQKYAVYSRFMSDYKNTVFVVHLSRWEICTHAAAQWQRPQVTHFRASQICHSYHFRNWISKVIIFWENSLNMAQLWWNVNADMSRDQWQLSTHYKHYFWWFLLIRYVQEGPVPYINRCTVFCTLYDAASQWD